MGRYRRCELVTSPLPQGSSPACPGLHGPLQVDLSFPPSQEHWPLCRKGTALPSCGIWKGWECGQKHPD